jgi:GDP-mannose 6-dehydrogenase
MVNEMSEVLDFADVVVVGNGAEEFRPVVEHPRPGQVIVDLVRISHQKSEPGRYDGICW